MALPPPSSDTTVAITGASSGIGAEIARALAGRGYNTTLIARRAERLEELGNELGAGHGTINDVLPADLADPDARDRLVSALHGGDRELVGLVNNAGFGSHGRFHELDLEREVGQVRLNVEAVHHLTGAVLPGFVERGAGAVLNVASLAAFQPLPGMATYAATKAFVASLSEAVHAELRGTGVSVTALCPGPVHTEFGAVAGVEGLESAAPELAYVDAEQVARAAVDGMIAGRRTVVPSLKWKATGLGGRLAPRSVLLPLVNRTNRTG